MSSGHQKTQVLLDRVALEVLKEYFFLEIVSGLFPKLPNGFCNAGHVHVAEYLKVPLHIFFTMPWTYVL